MTANRQTVRVMIFLLAGLIGFATTGGAKGSPGGTSEALPLENEAQVLLDDRETDAARKYKLLSYNTASKSNGLFLHYSADGNSWTPHSKKPLLEGLADCHHLLGWDPSIKRYVAFVRPDKVVRTIARTTS